LVLCIYTTSRETRRRKTRDIQGNKKDYKKRKNKGPIYLTGDFNARIQKATNTLEKEHIGKHTFEPEANNINEMTDIVIQNRELLVDLCQEHKLTIMNTQFQKTKEKLATYRKVGIGIDQEIRRGTHEQIDYIITQTRWKNTVQDAEADTEANIDTDHYPVKAKIRINLRLYKKKQTERKKYDKCTKRQGEQLNKNIQNKKRKQEEEEQQQPKDEEERYQDTLKQWKKKR